MLSIVVQVALGVAAVCLVWLALDRRARAVVAERGGAAARAWRRWRGRVRPRHPVVLVHGMMGFDKLGFGGTSAEYFRGVAAHLRGLGIAVFVARLPPLSGVRARALALARYVESIESKRVNVIAHSMGGIDARYAIAKLGLRKKVASLTTIGTPHRGTPLADGGARVLGSLGLPRLAGVLGLDFSACDDLTVARMARFNAEVEDASGVFYGSVVAAAGGGPTRVHPLLVPTHRLLATRAGDNDGIVPFESQRWGVVVAQVETDHWGPIGWSLEFDAPALYVRLARELAERGY